MARENETSIEKKVFLYITRTEESFFFDLSKKKKCPFERIMSRELPCVG